MNICFFTESNVIPKVPKDSHFPSNRISSLTKWSSCTYQKFCQSKSAHYLVDEDIPTPSDLFYMATVERGSGEILQCSTVFLVGQRITVHSSPLFNNNKRSKKDLFRLVSF